MEGDMWLSVQVSHYWLKSKISWNLKPSKNYSLQKNYSLESSLGESKIWLSWDNSSKGSNYVQSELWESRVGSRDLKWHEKCLKLLS